MVFSWYVIYGIGFMFLRLVIIYRLYVVVNIVFEEFLM